MLDKLQNKHLVIFVIVGVIIMTFLILNMTVKKEVAETMLKQYNQGKLDEKAYKDALADGKLTYLEVFGLKKK